MAVAALILAATAFDVAGPWALGLLVDRVAQEAPLEALWPALALYVGMLLGQQASIRAAEWTQAPLALSGMKEIGVEGFASLLAKSAGFHEKQRAGALARDLTRGYWAYDDLMDAFLYGLAPPLLVASAASLLMLAL